MHENDHNRARPSIVYNSDGSIATCCFIPMIAIFVASAAATIGLMQVF